MPSQTENTPKAPYLPYTTFKRFLSSLKSGAIPSRIDKTLMPGQSGSIQSWMISALRFFGLIDDNGVPKPDLESLVEADDQNRKMIWKTIFDRSYASIIGGLDLQRATLGQLNERFGVDFSSETVRKCQSFFSAAAEDAGIPLADHLKAKGRGNGPRKARKARSTNGSPIIPVVDTQPAVPQDMKAMLLAKFPAFDPAWPEDLKKQWFEGYGTLLKASI